MNLSTLTNKNLVTLDLEAKSKAEVIEKLVKQLDHQGVLESKEEFLKAVLDREKLSPTGLEEGLAIPHGKSTAVKKATFAIARLKTPIEDWESIDEDNEVTLVFLLAIPKSEQGDTHIEVLTKLTSLFIQDGFIDKLQKAKTEDEIINILGTEIIEEDIDESTKSSDLILAVTACPVGVAHTYLAADSLRKKAKEMGVAIKVETNGSIGIKNPLTEEDIKNAKGIIVAADKNIDTDRFHGKPLVQVGVQDALKKPDELITQALTTAPIHRGNSSKNKSLKSKEKNGIYKHLMNGVSHMLPLVVCGGVLIALSIALSGVKAGEGAAVTNPFFKQMLDLGVVAFGLMVPILAGFIASSIADRPGLAPGLVGGVIANNIGAGFLGGIIAGFAAGYIAKWVKGWKVPQSMQPIMPIFIIPLVATCLVGLIMHIVGAPISGFMEFMTNGLKSMEQGSILLALILGLMISFDMGGPVNKVAFLFGASMISQGVSTVMGPIAVAICVPPIGMGLATLMAPKKFETEEREAGKAALAMGCIGITEGAIPFAAADPLRVIPANMIGAGVGAIIAAIGSVADHAPHGGLIVLPVVDNKIMFLIAIITGSILTATITTLLKPKKQ
ncbi:fructose-specific PTS transporter subunit EIIC [Fusobacteria bacterium ZRK30]|nr:fructose-specific PTS transporter subunit EIIC [Fusobacteria bacterium ZRK30]